MYRMIPGIRALTLITAIAVTGNTAAAPRIEQGIQFGDVSDGRAIVWSRSSEASRMWVEYAYSSDFSAARKVRGPYATPETDYTAKLDLTGLAPGREVFVKVWFEGLDHRRERSEPVSGSFHTIGEQEDIRFVWGGDIAGQGWGINEAFGGMKIFATMREASPQFFILSGDNIYADVPIPVSAPAEDGATWTNIVTPEVSKAAETLDEFRGRYKYNLMDDNVRRFYAQVPVISQWDDHEVVNNWSDAKSLAADPRYTEKNVPLLIARASQAFFEYSPLRRHDEEEAERIYRKLSYGSLLDVFVLDMRSYRGPNTGNRQTQEGPETAFLGDPQIDWLLDALSSSDAVWKVIAADMPIGLNIDDDFGHNPPRRWEGIANGDDGPAAGRELEIARLLRGIKQRQVHNLVWLTADVHYAAAHFYNPARAATADFLPFWEFVAGPLNAGSFGPKTKDGTFGVEADFEMAPGTEGLAQGRSPIAGLQFFGEVNIDHESGQLNVALRDIDGAVVYRRSLVPVTANPGGG
ncbi:alkaline phosphatase D family protein [Haliea sp. E17]|uniref:alkaline phosphatase D family protein n=1 Tax=Haliea sp. E17 TaxID=3401576 RepID=UPI003AAEF4D9